MKKIIMSLALPAVIMLYGSCAALNVDSRFVEGVARPDVAVVIGRPIIRSADEQAFMSQSGCATACVARYGETSVILQYVPDKTCTCWVPIDVKTIGNASTAHECGAMVGQAGYSRYVYEDNTGRCGGRSRYEYVGIAETAKDCHGMTRGKYFSAGWASDTRRCFGIIRD